MKNEIKPDMAQEKLKFVALHWGQEFVYGNNVDEPYTNMFLVLNHLYNAPSAMYKVLLTPLSQITDEDAIQVAKIFRWTMYSTYSQIHQVKTFINENLNYHSTNISANEYFNMIDFLRSRGYALPFMGRSVPEMVELGWIKLKGDSNHG